MMLHYKNNRFNIGGLSYALPEDIYMDTNFERSLNNGFAFKSADKKLQVTIETGNGECEEYFGSEEFRENSFDVVEISPFGYADIKGVSAIYYSKYNEYCEIRLNLPTPSDEESILIILIEAKRGEGPVREAMKSECVINLLLSLRKEAPFLQFSE